MRSEIFIKEISQLLIELRSQKNTDEKNVIMDQIDSYFKDLYDKLNASQEIDEINFIKETIAVIGEYYAPIFNDLELIAINKLKGPRKSISFNRSYSESNLLVKIIQYVENIEKYKAIELGSWNADELPWGHTEIYVYEIDNLGNTKVFNKNIDGLTFILESYFNLPILKLNS